MHGRVRGICGIYASDGYVAKCLDSREALDVLEKRRIMLEVLRDEHDFCFYSSAELIEVCVECSV